jgi:uncharacterized protein
LNRLVSNAVGARERGRPTALRDRALAPDLARGVMLLLIALANSHTYLFGHQLGARGYPLAQDLASRLVTLAQMLLVDGRAYPLFGLLFGYGVTQLAHRQSDLVSALQLVRRRGWWLALIGFLHAALLFAGDIVAAYGLLAVLLAGPLVRGRDRTLLRIGVPGLFAAAVLGAGMGLAPRPEIHALLPSMATTSPLDAARYRIAEFLGVGLATNMTMVFGAVALGAWAGRRRLLDEPAAHRKTLSWLAFGGLGLAVLGGLPLALVVAGYWTDPGLLAVLLTGSLHAVTGYAGGIGYTALFGLLAVRIATHRPGPVTRALVACGQRSLTCYLAQSVVFVAILAAYGGGLGDQFNVAQTALIATGTWLVILLAAEAMRRLDIRGPAEVLLRKLTYRQAS